MGDLVYNRDKDPSTNATTLTFTGEARESPNALVAIAAGADAVFEVALSVDADESAGVDVQQLYRVKLTPVVGGADPGVQQLTVEVTPVLGAGGDAPVQVFQAAHPETMDAWQTAAGRPPQV